MKICILTQPLGLNYGGILQNYALQTILKSRGHEVWTEKRRYKETFIIRIKNINFLRKLFKKDPIIKKVTPTFEMTAQYNKNLKDFISTHINETTPIYSTKKRELIKYNFEAYIVGSDQVWRPKYSPNIYNFFLDFTRGMPVKRIAYAASFGVEDWEFTEEQTERCKQLIQHFDAISVREDSAIALCKEHFNRAATHLLDPTLLLEKEDYLKLVETQKKVKTDSAILTYLLDKTQDKMNIVNTVSAKFSTPITHLMPEKGYVEGKSDINNFILKPISEWIEAFSKAKVVITDSFHGTAFAIIFNKPFIAIANHERGLTRFSSLLKQFGLEDRLIYSSADLTDDLLNKPIDFEQVNEKRKKLQKQTFDFFKEEGL